MAEYSPEWWQVAVAVADFAVGTFVAGTVEAVGTAEVVDTAEACTVDTAEADTADIAEADFIGSLCPCLSVVLVFFPYTEIENH